MQTELIIFDSLIILCAFYGIYKSCCFCDEQEKEPLLNDVNYLKYNSDDEYVDNDEYVVDIEDEESL
tara:strand:+ start:3061 stop:3261 length:201 start_codon:yes stop_codon:yes gene_type:complete